MGWGLPGGRIEDCRVGLAYSRGLGHRVVAFQNQALGAELAEVLRVLLAAPQCFEGIHHMLYLVALKTVEMKVRSVKFGSDIGSALIVPPERRPVISKVTRERLHCPCGER